MRGLEKGLTAIVAACFTGLMAPLPALAEPLRIDNVPGLYKRVVAKPGVELFKEPGGAVLSKPKAFETFYVFATRNRSGKTWLGVGPTAAGNQTGWLAADNGIELNHLLVLCPATRQNRERAIFFKDQASLSKMAKDPARAANYKKLVEQAAADRAPAAAGAVGLEPQNIADCIDAFTFMPIVSAVTGQNANLSGSIPARFFETLSVPLPPKASNEKDFRSAMVFVVDTSKSMGPYIERIRTSVAKGAVNMRNTPGGKNVSFGLVAYRDSTKAAATPEFVTQIVHPLGETFNAAEFDAKLKALKESSASNADFREDAVAGLSEALKLPGWDKFQSKTIILVTDAGMREGDDPLSETRLTIEHIASEAQTKNISIVSVLLKTPAGKNEHAEAVRQHQRIGKADGNPDRLIEVDGGSVEQFGVNADKAIEAAIRAAGESYAAASQRLAQDCANPQRLSDADRVLCDLDATTQAMRIEWLGRRDGVTPPAFVKGWVADTALDSASVPTRGTAFRPFLLLSRNQMNDIVAALEPLAAIEVADIDSNRLQVLQILQGAIAQSAGDPSTLANSGCSGGANRCRLGDASRLKDLLPVWMKRLPLESRFMTLTVSDWVAAPDRRKDVDRIKGIVITFNRWIDDRRGWVKLSPGANRDEEVYAVPWDVVP